MRTLEYELESADICDLLWNLKVGKRHKAGHVFLGIWLTTGIFMLCGWLSLHFMPYGPQNGLGMFLYILTVIGGYAFQIFLISIGVALIQYVKMRRPMKSKRHVISLTEHWLDCKSTGRLLEQYPYSAIKEIELTRRLLIIYLDKKCSQKVMIPIPLRALPEGSAAPYVLFMEEKMRTDGGFSLQDEKTMVSRQEGCRYHFAFIQTKGEWIEAVLSAQNYTGRVNFATLYVKVIFCIVLTYPVVWTFLTEGGSIKAWVFLFIYMYIIFMIVVRTFRGKRVPGARKNGASRYSVKQISGTRVGKKTVDVMEDEVILCCGLERWNIPFEKVSRISDSPLGIYAFSKCGAFIHIPSWAFENDGERLQVLDFFREKGLNVVENGS